MAAVVCLVLGMVVSYVRAKAESLGFQANVGIAERAERLVSVLVVTGFTGLGLPSIVLFVTLVLLGVASWSRWSNVCWQSGARPAKTPGHPD